MSKLIVGCGYVGKRLAKAWRETGEEVYVTTRSSQRVEDFAARGWQSIVWDITEETDIQLPNIETVVFAVGFDRRAAKETGQTIQDVYVHGLERVLEKCPRTKRWIYLSSTGVYGQTDGSWVDEDSPCEPNREGGKACLAAENLLVNHPVHGEGSLVLRLAGIYGPDRLPQAKTLQQGEPLAVASDAFLNLIHVDDIVRIIRAVESIQSPQRLCVSDGTPVMRGDFYKCLAKLLDTSPPSFEPPPPGSTRAERGRGSKRIRNAKMASLLEDLLQPMLLYPTYREGLDSIVRG